MPLIFIIALGLYLFAHIYLFFHLRSALPRRKGSRWAAGLVLGFLFSTLFLVGFVQRLFPSALSEFFWKLGAWWFGFIFYATLILLLIDLVGWLIFLGRLLFVQGSGGVRHRGIGLKTLLTVGVAVVLLLLSGHLNARKLRVVRHPLRLKASCGPIRELDLVLISDLHLGVMVNRALLEQMVGAIEAIGPDLIVFAGDIVDRDIQFLKDGEVRELLAKFRAPLGVYAVTGNHEFISGADRVVDAFSRFGIVFLRDRAVRIGESFYLAGREDMTARWMTGTEFPLRKILAEVDRRCPVILIDHQPGRTEEAADERVDLILCGHTHHGQLFPLNLITTVLYPVSWGYGVIGETQIYVTGGAGTWGPPVRIGNTPEIVHLQIEFQ